MYTPNIHTVAGSFDTTQERAIAYAAENGHAYVHAFNDLRVIAGQGTIGLELLDQYAATDSPLPDFVLIPVGGGGLLAGVSAVLSDRWPSTRIIGVEPELVPSLSTSWGLSSPLRVAGEPTLAEGAAVAQVGTLTFAIIKQCVDEVRCVSENEIATAIVRLIEDTRVVVEGAGALGLAALMQMTEFGLDTHKDSSFLVLLSGGNLDITTLTSALQRGLAVQQRRTHFQFTGRDTPGTLAKITEALSDLGLNIVELNHTRYNQQINFGWTRVDVIVETEGQDHAAAMRARLQERGFDVRLVIDA
jgi:threonine dehydratase